MIAPHDAQVSSIYNIDRRYSWPPHGQVKPPLSPSLYEVLRTCHLRATFQATPGYPGRSTPQARLGTAFHKALEQLSRLAPTYDELGSRASRARAVEAFKAAVEEQQRESLHNVREMGLRWPNDTIERMEVAIALTVEQLSRKRTTKPNAGVAPSHGGNAVEETLASTDGLLRGRPDLVNESLLGAIVVDYKTGALDDPDVLARYGRQCLLYAWLWHERHGIWPVEYRLLNPITGYEYRAPVDPEVAAALARDACGLAQRLLVMVPPDLQASPGPHCRTCTFRPWCEPFWGQSDCIFSEAAVEGSAKRRSIQGTVIGVCQEGDSSRTAVLTTCAEKPTTVHVRRVDLSAETLQPDLLVRVLDATALAPDGVWLQLDSWSEIFVVIQ